MLIYGLLARLGKLLARYSQKIIFIIFVMLAAVPWALADSLDDILNSRNDLEASRDVFRNPGETLRFFEVGPGMTVVETLPGRGWYTKILVPYLGPSGHFIAANYTLDISEKIFGQRWDSVSERFKTWPRTFPGWAATFASYPPKISTYYITKAPTELSNSVDRVLFIRSLHHLNRFDPKILDQAAKEAFRLLKEGGIVGVVQHRAPLENSEEWSNGSNGYLHTSRVVTAFERAGLKFVAASEVNANLRDQPREGDKVWRLPPSLRVEDDEQRKLGIEVGESDRMTLKFVKRKNSSTSPY